MLYCLAFLLCYSTINSRLDGRVSTAIASEVEHLGLILSLVKPKAQKLVFTVLYLRLSTKGTVLLMMVMTIFKAKRFLVVQKSVLICFVLKSVLKFLKHI